MSVSKPFWVASVQVAFTQSPASQALELQSRGITQIFPSAQPGHCQPPQSTSVSVPLSIRSLHIADGILQRPLLSQKHEVQSSPTRQCWFTAQGVQVIPPQSMSVSSPL